MSESTLSFEEWWEQLMALGVKHDWPIENAADWRGYYDDDYTPREALKQDMSYGL